MDITPEEEALILRLREPGIHTTAGPWPEDGVALIDTHQTLAAKAAVAETETFPQGTEKLHPDSYGKPAEA